jgi:glycosyltransferase involved in cell wall biosynthesis
MAKSRVLVISAHRGLIDRRITAEINALAESGRDVTLVSVPAEIPEQSLQAGVRVVMPAANPASGSAGGGWRQGLHAATRIALAPLRNWIRNRRLTARARFFVHHTPPAAYDAIHCHDLDTLPAAQAVRAAVAPAARLIYDSHEFFPYQAKDRSFQRYWSAVEAKYIHRADRIITINESVAEQLAQLYRVSLPAVIYNSCGGPSNPAPLSTEAFDRHFGAEPGGFRVLFQGGLYPLRNLPNLVRALRQLDSSYRLFIIGTGPLERALRSLCAKHRLRNVYFGGFIPQVELLRYTAQADLGIIPYEDGGLLNNRYCTPNKLFEFIEAQVPICASALPELKRVVVDHGIGAVYPMGSAEEITAALRDCRQRCERGDFTPTAREQARRRFAWSEQGSRLLRLYEELGV